MENDKKPKLLISTDNFLPRWDGIARFLIEIVPRLSEKYSITIVAPNFENSKKKFGNVKVERIDISNIQAGDFVFSRFAFNRIKKLVNESDIVLNQTIGPIGILAIFYASRLNKPIASFTHSLEWELVSKSISASNPFRLIGRFITKIIAKKAYNTCDLLLVPSMEVEELLLWQGIKTDMEIVHLGCDTGKFVPARDKAAAKSKIGISPDKKVIGYIGRIGREKNLVTLFRAFVRTHKNHPDTVLLIVGKGVRTEEKRFFSRKDIIFAGSQDDVVPYYQAIDIYVLPSLTETSSLTTMEAMSCENAVVTTPVGAIKNYVIDRENGMFFPVKNALVLSMKMDIVLDNYMLRRGLGKAARETIKKEFNWNRTIETIDASLRKILV